MITTNENKKREPSIRSSYPYWIAIPTRWLDNDANCHVSHSVYYAYFDTVINKYLSEAGSNSKIGEIAPFCVESGCSFFQPLSFPQTVEVGIRVAHLGNSSVRYEIGVFGEQDEKASAQGWYVHVFVNRKANRATAIPDSTRIALQRLHKN